MLVDDFFIYVSKVDHLSVGVNLANLEIYFILWPKHVFGWFPNKNLLIAMMVYRHNKSICNNIKI